jgi:hypothetical protein
MAFALAAAACGVSNDVHASTSLHAKAPLRELSNAEIETIQFWQRRTDEGELFPQHVGADIGPPIADGDGWQLRGKYDPQVHPALDESCMDFCYTDVYINREAAEARGRRTFPPDDIADWVEKCSWDQLCAGCPECENNPLTCMDWCGILSDPSEERWWKNKTLPERVICNWGPCHGCEDCNIGFKSPPETFDLGDYMKPVQRQGRAFAEGSDVAHCSQQLEGIQPEKFKKRSNQAGEEPVGRYCFEGINDGKFGDLHAYSPGTPETVVGIVFDTMRSLVGFGLSRDRLGEFSDHAGGKITVQLSAVARGKSLGWCINETKGFMTEKDGADANGWTTVGTISGWAPTGPNIFMFNKGSLYYDADNQGVRPVRADGIRLFIENADTVIDELQVFSRLLVHQCHLDPGPGCTDNDDEICIFDEACSNTTHPDYNGGLGCNAGGLTNCRFCGFTSAGGTEFHDCPSHVVPQMILTNMSDSIFDVCRDWCQNDERPWDGEGGKCSMVTCSGCNMCTGTHDAEINEEKARQVAATAKAEERDRYEEEVAQKKAEKEATPSAAKDLQKQMQSR